MGCGLTREKIETEIIMLQLTREEIREEREAILQKLTEVTGKNILRPKIPDYLDHKAICRKIMLNKRKKLQKKDIEEKLTLNMFFPDIPILGLKMLVTKHYQL